MKIALYVPSWPPGFSPNGIVTYASYLVPALRQLGHEVFVLTFAAGECDDPYCIELRRFSPVHNLLNRALFRFAPETAHFNSISFAIANAIRELVAKHQIDVFEIEESFGWNYAITRLNLVPVVVRLHGPCFLIGTFDQINNVTKINREGRGIKYANYVTACCTETLNAVKNYYGLSLTKSRVIPNPVGTVPEEETWQGDAFNDDGLLYVGRFDKVKGGDLVLRAFGQLAPAFPRLKLTFIGPDRGLETVEGKKLSFHEFVHKNIPEGVRSRIDFRGQVSYAEVMALRTKHFITIIAARYDTQGYMMMEAMSCGCPIVAAAVGGIPEFIKDQRNGLLVPSQDVDAIASACKTLLENKGLAAKIGRQAWLDCRELYGPKNVAEQMILTYENAINAFGHNDA